MTGIVEARPGYGALVGFIDVKLIETFKVVERKRHLVIFTGVNVGQRLLILPIF